MMMVHDGSKLSLFLIQFVVVSLTFSGTFRIRLTTEQKIRKEATSAVGRLEII